MSLRRRMENDAKALVTLDQLTGTTLKTSHVRLDEMLRGR